MGTGSHMDRMVNDAKYRKAFTGDDGETFKPHDIEFSETMKERAFDANPRRHFEDRKFAMREQILTELIASGCLKETTKPTGNPGEYEITMTLRALK